MDEASLLISELRFKLAELDHKVWQYQRDMAAEFDNYAEGLLRDVPEHVSETVLTTIKESKKVYKSLYGEADTAIESCATGSSTTNNNPSLWQNGTDPISSTQLAPVPMPTSIARSDEIKGSLPRSPHEREKEFQGLFTPRYLPLLDDTSRNERRSSAATKVPTFPNTDLKDKQKENIMRVDASTDTRSLTNSPQVSRPPTPKRRNTDEVSIKSDWSDTTVRRSALRRSSGSSKGQSPRRVRFDVEGEEVLPTSSPVSLKSPIEEIRGISFAENVDEDARSEQIEDIDEQLAPKRLSSSQALRALSRSPLEDDGVQWTTVTAPPDGSASVATTNDFLDFPSVDMENGVHGMNFVGKSRVINIGKSPMQVVVEGDSLAKEREKMEADTPSGDEMMDVMTPLRRQNQPYASMLSPAISPNNEGHRSPTSPRFNNTAWQDVQNLGGNDASINDNDLIFDDDEEEMFNFDENISSATRLPEPTEEESSESEPELLIKCKKPGSAPSSFSRSPAREIIKPSFRQTVLPISNGIVGSYKGQPFGMPVVNQEVHDQAASLGVFDSFVGSIHDHSNVNSSYSRSASKGSFSGAAPRSFSERMQMEDIMEADENRKLPNGSIHY